MTPKLVLATFFTTVCLFYQKVSSQPQNFWSLNYIFFHFFLRTKKNSFSSLIIRHVIFSLDSHKRLFLFFQSSMFSIRIINYLFFYVSFSCSLLMSFFTAEGLYYFFVMRKKIIFCEENAEKNAELGFRLTPSVSKWRHIDILEMFFFIFFHSLSKKLPRKTLISC